MPRLAQKQGTPRQLKYKVHQTIDADSRVILDTEVTTGARHDNQPYLAQLQRVKDQHKVTICEATADRGYGSAAIIRTLQEQAVTPYIPLWSGRVGNGKYLKSELVYEQEHDRFRCPAGKYLTPNPAICDNHKRYVSSSEDCRDCPLASTCPAKRRTSTSHQRLVKRSLDQDLFEEVLAYMQESTFIERASERMWKCEGLFAEAKQIPLPRASEVSRPIQSADPGLSLRDRAEPQAPALPTLLLAVSAPLVLFDQHRACIAIQPIAPTNQLLNQKSIRTFSTGPTLKRHSKAVPKSHPLIPGRSRWPSDGDRLSATGFSHMPRSTSPAAWLCRKEVEGEHR